MSSFLFLSSGFEGVFDDIAPADLTLICFRNEDGAREVRQTFIIRFFACRKALK